VTILQTLTVSPISVAKAIHYFDQHNLGAIDPIENTWTGKLVDIARNENMPTELRDGLRQLFRHLAKRDSEFVDTTDLTIAVQTANLLVVLVQLGAITTDERDAFYALDGGRPYKEYTVEQYTADAATASAGQARQTIVDTCLAPIQAARDTAGARLNNATASLSAEHVDGLTLEQLQARCDAVAASADGLVGE
jgi:hypothetical protein